MRLVLDANVVVPAIYWPGPQRSLLAAARAGTMQLFTSTPMLIELADVMARAKFEPKRLALGMQPD